MVGCICIFEWFDLLLKNSLQVLMIITIEFNVDFTSSKQHTITLLIALFSKFLLSLTCWSRLLKKIKNNISKNK